MKTRIAPLLALSLALVLPGIGVTQHKGHSHESLRPLIVKKSPRVPKLKSVRLRPTSRLKAMNVFPPGCTDSTIRMQILVISADGSEPSLAAIREALDYHSVPHTVWIALQNPGQLTAGTLASGTCEGQYQGVVLANGEVGYSPDGGITWQSALTNDEWLALRTYEAQFGVREISWYAYPGADHGLNSPTAGFDTASSPVFGTLTADGAQLFPAINAANAIPIRNVWTYLATPANPAVKPLMVDAAGNALVSTLTAADGRESLTVTFDSNEWTLHSVLLSHGLVEWVTKGVYVGEYRAYLTPQVDDLYLSNDMFYGGEYRMTPADVAATHSWMMQFQQTTGSPDFRLAYAFNAFGSTPTDPLTLAVAAVQEHYSFINHTFTHLNLDALGYAEIFEELATNDTFSKAQGFTRYITGNLVTPDVSGLDNPHAMFAAADLGIRYTVSDTSRIGWNNPRPNIGIRNTIEPQILHVPRRPTNLFYNVASPEEWVAEYNQLYAAFWGRNLTYAEILDKESEFLLFYMLRGDVDPQMYHQPNLKAYDGERTLLSDLLEATWAKYSRHYKLPIVSPDMDVAAKRMENTMIRNESGLVPTLDANGVTLTSPVAVEVTVSGVCTSSSEVYAGKCITRVSVPENGTVSLPLSGG